MAGRSWRVKRGRKATAAVVLWLLGRGLVASARLDGRVQREVASWPDPSVVTLLIAPWGPRVSWRREGDSLTALGSAEVDPDLLVTFKSVDVALPCLLGMKGVLDAFAEHRSTVSGDLKHAMSLLRCLHIVEGYLFPDIMTRRILPRPAERSRGHLVAYMNLLHSNAPIESGERP
jgi:hypothetical protein